MPRIALEGLRKTYREERGGEVTALRDFTLSVESGELVTIVGPSGSGKTTLLRLIAGLERASGGRILFDGRDLAVVPPEQRGVAMVFQRGALFPHLSAGENLALGLRLQHVASPEIQSRVGRVAAQLGIEALLDRSPGTLSAGERQRVALGRALAVRPSVLLLDEPLGALDAPLQTQLRREIAALHRAGGLTIVHVTHDQDEALSLGTRVAVVRSGDLQQVGPPGELLDRPENAFVAGFIGSPPRNLLSGRLVPDGDGLVFLAGDGGGESLKVRLEEKAKAELASAASAAVTLGLRVEDVRLCASESAATDASAAVEIESLEYSGNKPVAWVKCGGQRLLAETGDVAGLRAGRRLNVRLRLERACWFEVVNGRRIWP